MIGSPLTAKRLGELAESVFQERALRLGYTVSKPFGETAPFDFIVGNPSRTLKRVQVKSAFKLRTGRPGYLINCRNSAGRIYSADEIDLLAAYIAPQETWFIIPRAALRAKSLRIGPRSRHWDRYCEAWWRLGKLDKPLDRQRSSPTGLFKIATEDTAHHRAQPASQGSVGVGHPQSE